MYLQTCRFCGKQDHQGAATMVKYGLRHHAHYACYLDAGKPLADLHKWQVGAFPYRLIVDRGLIDEVDRLTSRPCMTAGYIVMDSRAMMPASVKSAYRRVAVCHVEDINNPPKMISHRAKGMLRIMVLWEKLHVGQTEKGAYQIALAEANGLAATLNAGGSLAAWRAARRKEAAA